MAILTGNIFDIKKFSIHDGPGIRTTVFLKGCPLHCVWCHNPEGISPHTEIHFWTRRCISCHECVAACKNNAITFLDGKRLYHPELCQGCGNCADACPAEATQIIGVPMTVIEIMDEIEKDVVFYDQSGGGVTFSGGEPLLQIEFLERLLVACKDSGIHTAVDTSGHVPFEKIARVQPLVDLFLYDLKIIDPNRHFQYTGVPNRRILKNLETLVQSGANLIIRIPIIPGINDDPENINQTGRYLAALGKDQKVNILPYHRAATDKYLRMKHDYTLMAVQPPSDDHMAAIAERLERYDLRVSIGG